MAEKPMGAMLLKTGQCPMGWTAARSCFYCPFGNPTWCHYPCRHEKGFCTCRQYGVIFENKELNNGYQRSAHTLL